MANTFRPVASPETLLFVVILSLASEFGFGIRPKDRESRRPSTPSPRSANETPPPVIGAENSERQHRTRIPSTVPAVH